MTQGLCIAAAKCIGWDTYPAVPVCRLCKGDGLCRECKGEGGWVVELEVMRTEKKKVVLDGLDKIQEQLVTVYIPENKPCPLCGAHSTKLLELQATSSVVHGNVHHSTHEVERTTHLGSSSSVHRNYVGEVVEDLRHESWKGSGKCGRCKGSGKEPETTSSPLRKASSTPKVKSRPEGSPLKTPLKTPP